MTTVEELERLKRKLDLARERWSSRFEKALFADQDGEFEDASEEYSSLGETIVQWASKFFVNEDQQEHLSKIVVTLRIRAKALLREKGEMLSYDDIKLLTPVMRRLFVDDPPRDFPIDLSDYSREIEREMAAMYNVAPDEENARATTSDDRQQSSENLVSPDFAPPGAAAKFHVKMEGGSLKAPPVLPRGSQTLGILFVKCGALKPLKMVNPFIQVLCVDRRGNTFLPAQDTPPCDVKAEMARNLGHLSWSGRVAYNLQCSFDKLPRDTAFFFLIKRYKEKKKEMLTKAYAIMEQDEIKSGPIALELYLRPVDFTRNKVKLWTDKPLFLHLELQLG